MGSFMLSSVIWEGNDLRYIATIADCDVEPAIVRCRAWCLLVPKNAPFGPYYVCWHEVILIFLMVASIDFFGPAHLRDLVIILKILGSAAWSGFRNKSNLLGLIVKLQHLTILSDCRNDTWYMLVGPNFCVKLHNSSCGNQRILRQQAHWGPALSEKHLSIKTTWYKTTRNTSWGFRPI